MKYSLACDLALNSPMYSVPKDIKKKLENKFPLEISFVNCPELPKYNPNASIYWGNRIEPEMLLKMPKLKWVHFGSVGINRLNKRLDNNDDLIITSSRGTVNSSMITNIITLTGLFIRRLDIFFNTKDKPFTRTDYDLYFDQIKDFNGLNVLIIGLGNIGKELSKKFYDLGSVVDSLTNNIEKLSYINKNFSSLKNIDDLKKYDVIISLLPEKKDNNNFFNASFFSKTSNELIFLNFGRGSVLNEDDLLKSIDKGSPKFAILDVTKVEPLPSDSKLFKHPSIFLTPHIAAFSPAYWEKEYNLFSHNLDKFISREYNSMLNRIY